MVVNNTAVASRTQTVVARVENKAGVLARVVGLFARRGFNIESLAVAPTEDERFSRITFVYNIGSAPVEQVVSQVNKLVNVLSIEAVDDTTAIERDLLLATVHASDAVRALVAEYNGQIVDESANTMTVMVAARPDELDVLDEKLRSYGIVTLQRSGRIAIPKPL